MKLAQFLVDGILNEGNGKVIAAYGGGFKPPTKGHFQVVEDALAKHPEIDEFIIYVGSGTRDGISQLESILVWEVYNNHLPMKVKIEPSKSPIGDIIRLGKNNPQDTVYFIIGSREGNEGDQKDYESRTKNIEEKYPNMEIKLITTSQGEISGTKARKALLISPEEFYKFTPEVLNDNERGEVFDTLRQSISEILNENIPHSQEKFQDFFSKEVQHWVNEDTKDYGSILEYKIDLNNIYDYSNNNNFWEFYDDINQVKVIAKLKPTSQNVSEFKFYSLQGGKQLSFGRLKHYNPKVMNTIFKIFIDEVLPSNGKILIQPFDYTRYRLFKALISKNLSPQNYNIKIKDDIESPIIYIEKKTLNENASYSKDISIQEKIDQLTQHMLDKGMNIEPLPKVEFVDGDSDNAREFLGKTAYYNPETQTITLFTEGRHPKDIVRSFSHEMIHHIQNLEGRLGNITTTNTQEDDNLNDIEAEANLKGTMTFRNWTDSLNEIGDASSKSFEWKEGSASVYDYEVYFTTDLGTKYEVNIDVNDQEEFDNGKTYKMLDIAFYVESQAANQITNKGELFSVMATILNITKHYLKKLKANGIIYNPSKKSKEGLVDNQRNKLYKAYIQKAFPNAKIREFKYGIIALLDNKPLNEAIVGDKIECDNCDWSWNIVDGGDDLFICHKCGHDNKPITEETLLEEEDKLMAEVVNPDGERFEYEESNVKGLYTYEDSRDNLYFARITYSPSSPPRFEFKVGWFEDNDISKPKYDPQLPPNTTGMDNLKRRNTVSKIYRDEVLPYLKNNQKLAKQLDINPISDLRYAFSKRLVQRHTPPEYNIDLRDGKVIISLPKIHEKKTKDPFGLNQYARELASGLEEAITLNEGRYDKITNQVSREVFTKFKEIYDSGDKKGNFTFSVGPDDEEIFSNDLEFNLEGYIEVSDEMYQPDGGANAGYDDDGEEITPLIQVSFKIPQDPKEFKWSEISFDIKDIVRHEIEHLTQDGENIKSGKYLEDDQLLRGLINAKMLPKSQYFKLEKEVDAMLQGLYFRAKKSRTPFKEVILDYFKKVGLTKEEQKQILNVWRKRRKALALPTF